MKMRWTIVVLVLFVFSVLFVGGCSKKEQAENPVNRAIQYFPMFLNTTWTYKITLGEVEPLFYEEVRWPQGKGYLIYANSGRFVGAIKEENKGKDLALVLRIKGFAQKQGGLQYPFGLKIEVVEDDLMIFREAKDLFFAGIPNRFMFHQVVIHDGSESPANSGMYGGGEDGFSMRIFFFASSSGTSIGMGEEPKDSILFTGMEKIPGTQEEGMHFLRKVLSRNEKGVNDELGGAFTEDTWFARGKGLVRLEQKRDGKIAMTWVLEKFSK